MGVVVAISRSVTVPVSVRFSLPHMIASCRACSGLVGHPPGEFLPVGRPRHAELIGKSAKEGLNHASQLGVMTTF